MANTKLDVFNLAMFQCGTRNDIAQVNEQSREAEVCRFLYDKVRDHVLRAAYWSCAKKHKRLALLATRDTTLDWVEADPEPGYLFTYAAPDDFLFPRYLTTFERFTPGVTGDAHVIYSNVEEAVLAYTFRQENVALWDPNLFMAMGHALAAYACMPLNGKPSRAQFNAQQANNLILEARVANANSEDNQLDSIPPWIAARGYSGPQSVGRFYFPFGPLINASSPL